MRNMRYIVIKELKSSPKVTKNIYIKDFFFLLGYTAISFILAELVYPPLIIPYAAFSAFMALLLTMPSLFNQNRRNYTSIFIKLRKHDNIYQHFSFKEEEEHGENQKKERRKKKQDS